MEFVLGMLLGGFLSSLGFWIGVRTYGADKATVLKVGAMTGMEVDSVGNIVKIYKLEADND